MRRASPYVSRTSVSSSLIVLDELVLLEGGEPVQTQIQDRLGLLRREVVKPVAESELLAQVLRTAGVAASALEQRLHPFGCPAAAHERFPRFRRRR